jgi:hypothetical protein
MPRKRKRKRKVTTDRTSRKPQPKPAEARERPPKDSTLIKVEGKRPPVYTIKGLTPAELKKALARDKSARKNALKKMTTKEREPFIRKLKSLNDDALTEAVETVNKCLASGKTRAWGKDSHHYEKAMLLVDFIASAKTPEYEGGKQSKFSVSSLLSIDLEGKWAQKKGPKGVQARNFRNSLRVRIMDALRKLEPKNFRNLAFLGSQSIFTGTPEIFALAERKYQSTGKPTPWPSLSKSLRRIALGGAYPDYVGLRRGMHFWRDKKLSMIDRMQALETMARHPDKKDFAVIAKIFKEALKRRNRDGAGLILSGYDTIYYNHDLMSAKEQKDMAKLLMEISNVARKANPRKFPVFPSTMLDLVMQLDQPTYHEALRQDRKARGKADTVFLSGESEASTD